MLSTVAIAFGMSADAFAASIGRGAATDRLSFAKAARIGLIFGSVEAAMSLLGWAAGSVAGAYVAAVDHWIAFGLLGLVGLRMVREGLTRAEDGPARGGLSTGSLMLTAAGSGVDALTVGVTLSVIGADILVTALGIGATTCLMAGLGALIGRVAGARIGRAAETAGGLVLIAIGASILARHLGLWG